MNEFNRALFQSSAAARAEMCPTSGLSHKTIERSRYLALLQELDSLVGNVVESLKEHQMWNRTLLLVHSDNGGE